MKQLTIFVDMDGTIEKLLDVWTARLNAGFGCNVRCEDIKVWDMTRAYPSLTREQIFGVLDDSVWKEVQPIEGAARVLKKIIDQGHRVFIVTTTPYDAIRAKMDDLLFRCFPFFTWDNVVITSCKQLLKGDVMIDDGIHNLVGGDYARFLFNAPYNEAFDAQAYGMVRVHDWAEIEKLIDEMAGL